MRINRTSENTIHILPKYLVRILSTYRQISILRRRTYIKTEVTILLSFSISNYGSYGSLSPSILKNL